MTDQPPPQPAWGRILEEHRTRQGRSIRHVAMLASLSDAYWGQVERGYQASKTGIRIIKPSRGKLIEMAEVLRMTTKETNALLKTAEYPPLAGAADAAAGHQDYVDLTGLGRRDVRLLAALADRLRETNEAVEQVPLRAVASNRRGSDAEAALEASQKAARARREQSGK